MTYASNLKNNAEANYLVRLRLKTNALSWSTSGSFKIATFDVGYPVSLSKTTATYTQVASLGAMGSLKWFYDEANHTLYTWAGDYTSDLHIIVSFDNYLATFDVVHLRDPDNGSSDEIYWEPLVQEVPDFSSSFVDADQGFIQSFTANVVLNNTSHYFDKIVGISTFRGGSIDIWHWLTDDPSSNTSLVFTGITQSVSESSGSVTVGIFDNLAQLDGVYTHKSGSSTFSTSVYPNVEPTYLDTNIRSVYGFLETVRLVNVDYDADSPSRSNNRTYAICKHFGASATTSDLTTTIVSVDSGTQITVASSVGFRVNDYFQKTSIVGSFKITAISGNVITISTSTGSFSPGDTIRRRRLSRLFLYHTEKKTFLEIFIRYVPSLNTTTKCLEFTLDAFFEDFSDVSTFISPDTNLDPTKHIMFGNIYGEFETTTLGGSAFSSRSIDVGTTARWYDLLYSYLRDNVGIAESKIDTAAFSSLKASDTASNEVDLGYSLPYEKNGQFPTHREHIGNIMRSALGRIWVKKNGKITISRVDSMSSSTKTITYEDVVDGSFSYNTDSNDYLSRARVKYAPLDPSEDVYGTDKYTYRAFSDSRIYLINDKDVEKEIYSLCLAAADADLLAKRAVYYYGYPKNTISIKVGLDFYDVEPGDVITLVRPQIFGSNFVEGSTNSKDYLVIQTNRSRFQVELLLTDNVGPNNYSGDF